MEKSYRDLFDKLTQQAGTDPALGALLSAVRTVDEISPLRVPQLIAMKREPIPTLNLEYRLEHGQLGLHARNPLRKNKSYPPALCARIDVPAWLFEPTEDFPGRDAAERAEYVSLIRRSFGYLEIRISNYFPLAHDSRLNETGSPVRLTIATEAANSSPERERP